MKKKYIKFHDNNKSFLKLFWIPSHHGIEDNEVADKLTKEAARSNELNITNIPYIPYSTVKENAIINTTNAIKRQSLHTGKTYFTLFYKDSRVPWFKYKNLSRPQITTINRIRANHYNLASSLARINIINNSNCKCGKENEDISHVL